MEKTAKKTTSLLIKLDPKQKAEIAEIAEYRGISMAAVIGMAMREEYRRMMIEKEYRKK